MGNILTDLGFDKSDFDRMSEDMKSLNHTQTKHSERMQDILNAFKDHTNEDKISFVNLTSELKFVQKLLWFILSIVGFCAGGIGGEIFFIH